jgi:hypothetical protein
MLFEGGKNVKQVAAWLGHADPGFTLRTYVHLMDDGVGRADFLDGPVQVGKPCATQQAQARQTTPSPRGANPLRAYQPQTPASPRAYSYREVDGSNPSGAMEFRSGMRFLLSTGGASPRSLCREVVDRSFRRGRARSDSAMADACRGLPKTPALNGGCSLRICSGGSHARQLPAS